MEEVHTAIEPSILDQVAQELRGPEFELFCHDRRLKGHSNAQAEFFAYRAEQLGVDAHQLYDQVHRRRQRARDQAERAALEAKIKQRDLERQRVAGAGSVQRIDRKRALEHAQFMRPLDKQGREEYCRIHHDDTVNLDAALRALDPDLVPGHPEYNEQLDLLVPQATTFYLRDKLELLSFTPGRLEKRANRGKAVATDNPNKRVYKLHNGTVTISAGADYGLATIYDYDLPVYLISMANDMRDRAGLVPRTFRVNAKEFRIFTGRKHGGRQKEEVESMLDRLGSTYIKFKPDPGAAAEAFGCNLIGHWREVRRDGAGRLIEFDVSLPEWVYEGVMLDETRRVLSLNPAYFHLQPIPRQTWRFLRHRVGVTKTGAPPSKKIDLDELYQLSGSRDRQGRFVNVLKGAVDDDGCLADYHLDFHDRRGGHGYMVATHVPAAAQA